MAIDKAVDSAVLNSYFTGIANAIRGKNGSSATYTPAQMAAAIAALQGEDTVQHADIPSYVKAEAQAVANRVRAKLQNDSIVVLTASDSHQIETNDTTGTNTMAGNLHAGQALKALAYMLPIDFAAYLGDYTAGSGTTTLAEGRQHFKHINENIDEAFRGLVQFRTVGNHDPLGYSYSQNGEALSQAELYQFIGKYNDDGTTVMGSTTAGYCYRDFAAKSLRVICLNTADVAAPTGGAEACSDAQKKWFADTLISTPQDYGVLILSHHPLDWGNIMSVSHILRAYVEEQSSINIGGTTYSFTNKHKSAWVLQIHGHTHTFTVDNLHWNNGGTGVAYDVKRIACPCTNFVRTNEYGTNSGAEYYGIEFGTPGDTRLKVAGGPSDTAFCVYVINPSEKKVYAICYGTGQSLDSNNAIAGYDREIYFGEIAVPVTGVTLSASSGTLNPGGSITLTATVAPTGATNKTVTWTSSNTSVATVNGGVVTAVAIGSATITVTTQDGGYTASYALSVVKVPEGNIISRIGYFDGKRISGSSSAANGWMTDASGYVTTGFIDLTDEPQVIRLKGANFNSSSYWAAYWGIFANNGQTFGKSGPIKTAGETISYGYMSMSYTVTSNAELTITVQATRTGGLNGVCLKFCGYGSGANLDLRIDEPFD